MTDFQYYLITFEDFFEILKALIREKMADKVISGETKRNRFQVSPILESDPQKLENFPLSSLFIYNFDRINSASKFLHKKAGGALNEKIAMIGHPADARALVELAKRLQVNLDNIFTIVFENIGTIQGGDMVKLLKDEGIEPENVVDDFLTETEYLLKLKDGSIKKYPLGKKIDITPNDKRADVKKLDDNFDLAVTWITLEPFSHQLAVRTGSEKGRDLFSKLNIKKVELDTTKLDALLKKQAEIMKKAREQKEKDVKEYLIRPDRIKELAKCTMCGVCINACPVCFCTDCVLQKQRKEKDIDMLSYQMTRVAHVGDSCVNCGKCDQNCPTNLPLSLYFYSVTEKVKKQFKYETGMNKKEPIPRSWTAIERGST